MRIVWPIFTWIHLLATLAPLVAVLGRTILAVYAARHLEHWPGAWLEAPTFGLPRDATYEALWSATQLALMWLIGSFAIWPALTVLLWHRHTRLVNGLCVAAYLVGLFLLYTGLLARLLTH